ncbi:MAG TPA: alpha/beta family hydrolase [Steroidobacteraceae bacterium]|nr:alpha/beta family hydrolase [Steroidobacteraceae bacterium]
MSADDARPVTIPVKEALEVAGLWQCPAQPRAAFVFAHGAGAGMAHPFMEQTAHELAAAGVATLRFQFPYFDRGGRRPDPPALCHATVRAAVARASELSAGLPLFAGGKSFGARMTSQAQALIPLPAVRGLIFIGFPLHPAKRPGTERARHLHAIRIPMLFLQGTRDALAELALLEPLIVELLPRATLYRLEAADHAFHVPARTGRTDAQVRAELVRKCVDWMGAQGAEPEGDPT